MALQPETVEITFEGLDQKTDGRSVKAGKLVVAKNVEFEKGGRLNKRRGYRRYPFGSTGVGALGVDIETQATRVVSHNGELLIFGIGWLWSLVDVDEGIDGKAAVRRGRVTNGNLKVLHVASGEEATDATTIAAAAT